MSNVYQLEPPTEGKVLLTTTHGEIEVELWAKEAPKACRNFVQLCLEGYYDGCIFHRIIKEFMIQTGDPTGTGRGGDSIYGDYFKDELHSRIKFNHRGQVAMANAGAKDTNGSQFFITLDRCDWIERKHTIFGKVTGHTIYNALQIAELETEGDRPVEPFPKITKTEVLWNPFDDIIPRVTKRLEGDVEEGAAEKKKRKKKETKKLNLLSFGEEAGEEDEELAKLAKPNVKSIFDADAAGDGRIAKPGSAEEAAALDADASELERTKAFRERMRAKLAAREAEAAAGGAEAGVEDEEVDGGGEDDETGGAGRGEGGGGVGGDAGIFEEQMRAKTMAKRKELGSVAEEAAAAAAGWNDKEDKRRRKEQKREEKERREAERREREANKLRKLGIGKAKLSSDDAALLTEKEVKRVELKNKRKLVVGREKDMLAKLARFQTNLVGSLKAEAARKRDASTTGDDAPVEEVRAEKQAREGAVGISRFVSEGLYYADEDEEDDSDWKSHSLKFVRDDRRDPGSYEASVDDYVVEDPLLNKGKEKFLKSKAAKRMNEWAGRSLD